MTKAQLLTRLNGIEWNDFEIKEAKNEVPKTAWETVSAFSNSYGGWIVFGVKEKRIGGKSTYEIQGVEHAEKVEQDFITVLRAKGKFNQRISVQSAKFDIDGKVVLAFYIPMSEFKPVYISVPLNSKTIVSQPRNPNILRFFKLARLSENGGYGIDKILTWKNLTDCDVTIESDITKSEVRFELPINVNQRQSTSININQHQSTSININRHQLTLINHFQPKF